MQNRKKERNASGMRLFLKQLRIFLICRAEGSNLLLDPHLICKKTRRLRGKYVEMCKNETYMMREISRGISMGFKECEHQFKHHRWNCSSIVRSMRKILHKGENTLNLWMSNCFILNFPIS